VYRPKLWPMSTTRHPNPGFMCTDPNSDPWAPPATQILTSSLIVHVDRHWMITTMITMLRSSRRWEDEGASRRLRVSESRTTHRLFVAMSSTTTTAVSSNTESLSPLDQRLRPTTHRLVASRALCYVTCSVDHRSASQRCCLVLDNPNSCLQSERVH